MFEIGDTVLYGSDGVCTVQDIVHKEVGGVSGEYYVLESVYQRKSVVFVPLDNERLVGKMRRTLPEKDLFDVVDELDSHPLIWINDEANRKSAYRDIISRGDCTELMLLVRTLLDHKQTQEAKGKKLHASDDRFLKTAERMVHDEFAVALGVDPEKVPELIAARLDRVRRAGDLKASNA